MIRKAIFKAGIGIQSNLLVPTSLLLVLLLASAARGPSLFSRDGIAGAIIIIAPLMLATLALTPVALVGRGGIDLSVGPLMGLINVTLVKWLVGTEYSSPVFVISYALALGVCYQLLQGLIIICLRVSPIIVTLSGFLMLSGLNLVIMDRPSGSSPDWMAAWGRGTEVFTPDLLVVAGGLVLWFVVTRTAFYLHVRLTGADERMAFASGVRVDLVRLGSHVLAGIYVALAALTFTALMGSGDPRQGSTYTLSAVTALVLGGTSLAGGRGGGLGSIFGAIDMYLMSYVLSTFSFGIVSAFVTQMAFGIILVLSMLASVMFTSRTSVFGSR
jgi:ribose transport system permease protein